VLPRAAAILRGPITRVVDTGLTVLAAVPDVVAGWRARVGQVAGMVQAVVRRVSLASRGVTGASPALGPLPTCASPQDVHVPPCIHTLGRPSLIPDAVFAAQFLKLYILTDSLRRAYPASGVYDGYTLVGTVAHPSAADLHVSALSPVARLLGRGDLSVVLVVTLGHGEGTLLRQVEVLGASGAPLRAPCTGLAASDTALFVASPGQVYMVPVAGLPTTLGPSTSVTALPAPLLVAASGGVGVMRHASGCMLLAVGHTAASATVFELSACSVPLSPVGFSLPLPPAVSRVTIKGIVGLVDVLGGYVILHLVRGRERWLHAAHVQL
jgi:hypothetical protein